MEIFKSIFLSLSFWTRESLVETGRAALCQICAPKKASHPVRTKKQRACVDEIDLVYVSVCVCVCVQTHDDYLIAVAHDANDVFAR